jgi:hypothetical protein
MSVIVRYNDDACSMAEHGLGIAVTFDYTVMGGGYPNLKAIPLKTENFRLQILRHNGVSFSHSVRRFYDIFKTELSALGKSPNT